MVVLEKTHLQAHINNQCICLKKYCIIKGKSSYVWTFLLYESMAPILQAVTTVTIMAVKKETEKNQT